MKKSRLMGAVCAVTLIVLASTARAAVVNPILGLDIGGTLYDVTFHDGTGDSFNALWDADDDGVFGGGSSMFSVQPTFWGDESGALLAANAISTWLMTSGNLTTTGSDSYFIPYGANDGNGFLPLPNAGDWIDLVTDADITPATTDIITLVFAIPDGSAGDAFRRPYASFQLTSVPLPAAFWLFGSGLIGLIGVARRKKT